jgi:hypothetical protein
VTVGIADKLRQEDEAARRSTRFRWLIASVAGLALFVFILLYFLLPMWRGAPQP